MTRTDQQSAGERGTRVSVVDLGTRTRSYRQEEALLYAVAVGARPDELDMVYERVARNALPTWATALGIWVTEAASAALGYEQDAVLHISQGLRLYQPLPLAGEIEMSGAVTGVFDKGSAAVVHIRATSAWFDANYVMYVPGLGGLGGPRGTRERLDDLMPTVSSEIDVRPDAAALYRLTGDPHPVHIDPEAARRVGHRGPILHGLCTLGMAVVATARQQGVSHNRIAGLHANWSHPAFPGQSLTVRSATTSKGVRFDAAQAGIVVVDGSLHTHGWEE